MNAADDHCERCETRCGHEHRVTWLAPGGTAGDRLGSFGARRCAKRQPDQPANPGTIISRWAALFIPTDPNGVPEAAPRFFVANLNNPGSWPPCLDQLADVTD